MRTPDLIFTNCWTILCLLNPPIGSDQTILFFRLCTCVNLFMPFSSCFVFINLGHPQDLHLVLPFINFFFLLASVIVFVFLVMTVVLGWGG